MGRALADNSEARLATDGGTKDLYPTWSVASDLRTVGGEVEREDDGTFTTEAEASEWLMITLADVVTVKSEAIAEKARCLLIMVFCDCEGPLKTMARERPPRHRFEQWANIGRAREACAAASVRVVFECVPSHGKIRLRYPSRWETTARRLNDAADKAPTAARQQALAAAPHRRRWPDRNEKGSQWSAKVLKLGADIFLQYGDWLRCRFAADGPAAASRPC